MSDAVGSDGPAGWRTSSHGTGPPPKGTRSPATPMKPSEATRWRALPTRRASTSAPGVPQVPAASSVLAPTSTRVTCTFAPSGVDPTIQARPDSRS